MIPHLVGKPTVSDVGELLEKFWSDWMMVKKKYGRKWIDEDGKEKTEIPMAVADCGFPVEAGLFSRAIGRNLPKRRWDGPYPLHEIATFTLAAGFDSSTLTKRENEKMEHNPLHDSRFSARIFLESYKILNKLHAN